LKERGGTQVKLVVLKALGVVLLLFLAVYLPTFSLVSLIRSKAQVAIPLVIALSLTIAFLLIFLISRGDGLPRFGFRLSSGYFIWVAIALATPTGLALTFLASRFHQNNPLGDISLRPWMVFLYFIVGSPIQEEVIFRGLLQSSLARRVGLSLPVCGTSVSFAVLAVAVLFGLIHVAVGIATAIAAFILGILGRRTKAKKFQSYPGDHFTRDFQCLFRHMVIRHTHQSYCR
jgi:membrane protease YdiL (CAAX protease family)